METYNVLYVTGFGERTKKRLHLEQTGYCEYTAFFDGCETFFLDSEKTRTFFKCRPVAHDAGYLIMESKVQ